MTVHSDHDFNIKFAHVIIILRKCVKQSLTWFNLIFYRNVILSFIVTFCNDESGIDLSSKLTIHYSSMNTSRRQGYHKSSEKWRYPTQSCPKKTKRQFANQYLSLCSKSKDESWCYRMYVFHFRPWRFVFVSSYVIHDSRDIQDILKEYEGDTSPRICS